MILVEKYENDFVKGDLKFNLTPKFIYSYYEGNYKGICFEIKDGNGEYPEINWLEDASKFTNLIEIEDEIIKDFIIVKYNG